MGKWRFWTKQDVTPKKGINTQRLRKSGNNYAPPVLILWLWPFLDRIVSKWLHIEPLRKDKISLMNIELRRYRGQPVELDDGTIITSGNLLIELHLNNAWFLNYRNQTANSTDDMRWRISTAFTEEMKYLAGQFNQGKLDAGVKALHGITMLDSPARRHNFTVTELPDSLRRRLTTFYLSGLRRFYYSRKGDEYARLRKPPVLKEVWMSKSRLLENYGSST